MTSCLLLELLPCCIRENNLASFVGVRYSNSMKRRIKPAAEALTKSTVFFMPHAFCLLPCLPLFRCPGGEERPSLRSQAENVRHQKPSMEQDDARHCFAKTTSRGCAAVTTQESPRGRASRRLAAGSAPSGAPGGPSKASKKNLASKPLFLR